MIKEPLIVILTHNRPKIMERCITFAIKNSKVATYAHWIVIDDSDEKNTVQNSKILRKFCNMKIKIYHITQRARNEIEEILSNYDDKYYLVFSKPTKRDISGLRNLGLFFSILLEPQMTFFMDEDIVSCNKDLVNFKRCFFDIIFSKYKNDNNWVIGAPLGGVIDESYIGRLEYLLEQGKNAFLHEKKWETPKNNLDIKRNSLWVKDPPSLEKNNQTDYVSAGFFSFKLRSDSVIPFPSEYNEDWNWCLLQKALHDTIISKEQIPVIHAPPSIFQPEPKLLLWESLGELIFDSLYEVILSKNQRKDIESIHICVKEKFTIRKKTMNQLKIIKTLKSFEKNSNKEEKKKINECVFLLEDTIKSLEKIKISEFIDCWFRDFKNRKIIFSDIIKNKKICDKIHRILIYSELKEKVVNE